MARIYTRTGDRGETGIIGARVPKTDPHIQAMGDVDELNATIGIILSYPLNPALRRILQQIQKDLFSLGTMVATIHKPSKISITPRHVRRLEKTIDRYQTKLPPLRRFILPGGTTSAALLHFARAVCRRAERSVVRLQETSHLQQYAVPYLNRLSDLLFILARVVNQENKVPETQWMPENNP